MRTEFSDNQAKYKRGGVHRRLRESNSLSNLSADPIRIGVNSNRIGRYVDATPGKVCFVYTDERGARKIEWGELVEKDSGFYVQYADPIPSSLYAYLREHKDMSEISDTGSRHFVDIS